MHFRLHSTGAYLLAILVSVTAWRCDDARAADADQVDIRLNLVYAEQAGQKLLCDVYLPAGEGPFPGVLCVHGGAWRLGSKEHMVRIGRMLARAGYVAVAINYRLAPAHTFPAQLVDCRDAAIWMQNNAADLKIDPDRLGALGYSAGAQLVALLAMTRGKIPGERTGAEDGGGALELGGPLRFDAVVAGGTPAELRGLPENSSVLSYWLGGTRREFPERYEAASPAAFVAADVPPMFFFHGETDLLVPLDGVKTMVAALEKAGAVAELYVLPKMGHIVVFFYDGAYQRAIGFLDKHLKTAR